MTTPSAHEGEEPIVEVKVLCKFGWWGNFLGRRKRDRIDRLDTPQGECGTPLPFDPGRAAGGMRPEEILGLAPCDLLAQPFLPAFAQRSEATSRNRSRSGSTLRIPWSRPSTSSRSSLA